VKILRIPIIAGNWKMHNTIGEAAELVKELVPLIDDKDREVVLCPSFISLSEISKLLKGTNIKLGAQNMYHEDKGAFTGEAAIFLRLI
jgi:triosephosphate isomerase